jgi:hypothetical protein
MNVPSEELTDEDRELIEFAHEIVDANTDGEYGVYTMGAAVRAADGKMYGGINVYHHPGIRVILPTPDGVRSVRITDLMPLGTVWDPVEGTKDFDPGDFEQPATDG